MQFVKRVVGLFGQSGELRTGRGQAAVVHPVRNAERRPIHAAVDTSHGAVEDPTRRQDERTTARDVCQLAGAAGASRRPVGSGVCGLHGATVLGHSDRNRAAIALDPDTPDLEPTAEPRSSAQPTACLLYTSPSPRD